MPSDYYNKTIIEYLYDLILAYRNGSGATRSNTPRVVDTADLPAAVDCACGLQCCLRESMENYLRGLTVLFFILATLPRRLPFFIFLPFMFLNLSSGGASRLPLALTLCSSFT